MEAWMKGLKDVRVGGFPNGTRFEYIGYAFKYKHLLIRTHATDADSIQL
ncbi:hypothetical protein HL29_03004 [Listeria monocytogenes]|nr:hypothetical protein HL29_03004 [Listeria monocytogenes]